jgi:hypothetical protein
MKLAKLSQDVIRFLWAQGLAGKLIYVPKQGSSTLVASYTQKLLEEIEATYEKRRVTFYWESSPRKVFSGMFSASWIASQFHLRPRTAARVSSAAYKAWREWFSHKERLKLEQLRTMAEENGWNYTDLFFSYLKIRGQIRSGQEVDLGFYTGYHSTSRELIQPVIDLAKASIESCPWRSS